LLQFLPLPGDVSTFREDGTGARLVALLNRRFDVSGRAGRPSQRRDRPGERYRRETLKRSPLVLAIRSSTSSVSAPSRGETFTPRALTAVALSWKHGKMGHCRVLAETRQELPVPAGPCQTKVRRADARVARWDRSAPGASAAYSDLVPGLSSSSATPGGGSRSMPSARPPTALSPGVPSRPACFIAKLS
jgi:hypothetical protein